MRVDICELLLLYLCIYLSIYNIKLIYYNIPSINKQNKKNQKNKWTQSFTVMRESAMSALCVCVLSIPLWFSPSWKIPFMTLTFLRNRGGGRSHASGERTRSRKGVQGARDVTISQYRYIVISTIFRWYRYRLFEIFQKYHHRFWYLKCCICPPLPQTTSNQKTGPLIARRAFIGCTPANNTRACSNCGGCGTCLCALALQC